MRKVPARGAAPVAREGGHLVAGTPAQRRYSATAAVGGHIIGWADDWEVSGATDPMTRPQLGPWPRGERGPHDGLVAAAVDVIYETVYDPGNGVQARVVDIRANRERLRADRQAGLYDAPDDGAWFREQYAAMGRELVARELAEGKGDAGEFNSAVP